MVNKLKKDVHFTNSRVLVIQRNFNPPACRTQMLAVGSKGFSATMKTIRISPITGVRSRGSKTAIGLRVICVSIAWMQSLLALSFNFPFCLRYFARCIP